MLLQVCRKAIKFGIPDWQAIIHATSFLVSCKLAEVGRLDTPKLHGRYDTGQLFLHRVFGYRGVILFPWLARVYDRDIPNKISKYNDTPLEILVQICASGL